MFTQPASTHDKELLRQVSIKILDDNTDKPSSRFGKLFSKNKNLSSTDVFELLMKIENTNILKHIPIELLAKNINDINNIKMILSKFDNEFKESLIENTFDYLFKNGITSVNLLNFQLLCLFYGFEDTMAYMRIILGDLTSIDSSNELIICVKNLLLSVDNESIDQLMKLKQVQERKYKLLSKEQKLLKYVLEKMLNEKHYDVAKTIIHILSKIDYDTKYSKELYQKYGLEIMNILEIPQYKFIDHNDFLWKCRDSELVKMFNEGQTKKVTDIINSKLPTYSAIPDDFEYIILKTFPLDKVQEIFPPKRRWWGDCPFGGFFHKLFEVGRGEEAYELFKNIHGFYRCSFHCSSTRILYNMKKVNECIMVNTKEHQVLHKYDSLRETVKHMKDVINYSKYNDYLELVKDDNLRTYLLFLLAGFEIDGSIMIGRQINDIKVD